MHDLSISARARDLVLANGARLTLIENRADVTVDIVGLFEGGLFLEAPERSGLANLTLEMLDRGTKRRDEREISDALESNGIQLEYALLREAAGLRARCLSDDLPLLVDLLGETLNEPSFPEEQLRLCKEQILADLRETDFDTFEQASKRAAVRLLGESHPYAREPQGEPEIVSALQAEELEDFRRATLTGARLRLVVIGDIDPDAVSSLLARALTALPEENGARGGIGGAATAGEIEGGANASGIGDAETAGERFAVQDDRAEPGLARPLREHVEIPDKEQIDIVFLRPGIPRTDPGFEAYGVANFILGGSFVARLNQSLRDRAGLTYGAHSTIVSGRHPGYWLAATGVPPAQVGRAIDIVEEELARFADRGVEREELEIARDHLLGAFPIRLETNRGLAAFLLDGMRFGRGRDYAERYPERLRALTLEQVNAAARRLIRREDLIVVTAGTLE